MTSKVHFLINCCFCSDLMGFSEEEEVAGPGMGNIIALSATAPTDDMESQTREAGIQRKLQRQLSRQLSSADQGGSPKKTLRQLSERASSRKLLRQKSVAAEKAKERDQERSRLIDKEKAETGMVRICLKS